MLIRAERIPDRKARQENERRKNSLEQYTVTTPTIWQRQQEQAKPITIRSQRFGRLTLKANYGIEYAIAYYAKFHNLKVERDLLTGDVLLTGRNRDGMWFNVSYQVEFDGKPIKLVAEDVRRETVADTDAAAADSADIGTTEITEQDESPDADADIGTATDF